MPNRSVSSSFVSLFTITFLANLVVFLGCTRPCHKNAELTVSNGQVSATIKQTPLIQVLNDLKTALYGDPTSQWSLELRHTNCWIGYRVEVVNTCSNEWTSVKVSNMPVINLVVRKISLPTFFKELKKQAGGSMEFLCDPDTNIIHVGGRPMGESWKGLE